MEIRKAIRRLTEKTVKTLGWALEWLERYLYVATFILALLFALLGVAGIATLVAHSMPADTAGARPNIYAAFCEYIWILFSMVSGEAPNAANLKIVEQFTNAMLFALTLLAIVLSVLYLPSERRKLRNSAPYYEQNFRATSKNVNDKALPVMKRIYDNATRLQVIAGDYDWLLRDDDIARRVCQMVKEKKATLFSYKTHDDVEFVWKDRLHEELYSTIFRAIIFEKSVRMKASLITTAGGTESLIFLTEHNETNISSAEERRRYAIFEYHNKGASSSIVDMAKNLFNGLT